MKSKPIKQANNTNSIKQTIVTSAQSSLLGKVDLDDEDDLLSKYQSKPSRIELEKNDDDFTLKMNKFNSSIQTMIDSKWNAYKTSFHQNDEEEQIHDDDDDDEDNLYSTNRQRTSSHGSDKQTKFTTIQPKKV